MVINCLQELNRVKGNYLSDATNQSTKYATFRYRKIAHTHWIQLGGTAQYFPFLEKPDLKKPQNRPNYF